MSGLPRSGSTLLAAILRQNPRFHASMSNPLADIVTAVLRAMILSGMSILILDAQRAKILRAIIDAYFPQESGAYWTRSRFVTTTMFHLPGPAMIPNQVRCDSLQVSCDAGNGCTNHV